MIKEDAGRETLQKPSCQAGQGMNHVVGDGDMRQARWRGNEEEAVYLVRIARLS